MNSAKKIMKNQGNTKSRAGVSSYDLESRKNLILIIVGLVLIVGISAVVCYIQLRPRAILKVTGKDANGKEVTNTLNYPDAMYDILSAETQYNTYESLYQQIYGSSYWNAENVDGKGSTGSQAAKKQIMNSLKQREILYMEAQKNGITLTDDEKKEVSDNLSTVMKNITDKQKKMKGLSESAIREVLEKQAIADKYKKQVIAGLGIDEEALKATVSKKDYRQYTLQYYTISKTEASGSSSTKTKTKSDKDLAQAKKDITALQKKAATAEDFTKNIITDSNNDNTDDKTGISYATKDLIEKDTDFLDAKTRKIVKKMKNNTVSDVIETDDGYYVIKMVNNNDSEAYDAQREKVVKNEQESKFDEKYKADIKPNYQTEVQSYWKGRVTLGYITTDTSSSDN